MNKEQFFFFILQSLYSQGHRGYGERHKETGVSSDPNLFSLNIYEFLII